MNNVNASPEDHNSPTTTTPYPKTQDRRLDFTHKTNQETVHQRLIDLASTGVATPIVAELDLTTYCDYECPECISSSLLSTVHLTDSEIDKIINTLFNLQIKAVILTGGGEPLRHHAAVKVIDKLSSEGIKVGLVTNGLLVNKIPTKSLEKLDWIRISLDAATVTTYLRYRPHRLGQTAYKKVLDNIEYASNYAKAVGVSFVVLTRHNSDKTIDNINEIEECAKIAKDKGASYLNVKAMELPNHHLYRYSKQDISRIRNSLIASKRRYVDDKFDIIVSSNLDEIINRNGLVRQDKKYRRCLSSALRVTITSKGVFPCSYHRGNLKLNYNPRRDYDSLDEILSYPHLPEVNPSVDCPFFCARHYVNLSLESQLKTLTDDKLFTPNKDWDLFL